MSSTMHVRLLRVLQERRVRPVGLTDSKTIEWNARVVDGNRDLKREVLEEKFRQDLHYRVNVLPIRPPALRDQIGDLPLRISRPLKRFSNESNPERHLQADSEALRLLRGYRWAGYVRELENIIERLALTVSEMSPMALLTRRVVRT